jgi:hypothetical protein
VFQADSNPQLTISDLIRTQQIKMESSDLRVDLHDSIVDAYRVMSLHGESLALVCECLKECGYVRLRDLERQLLSVYFPHLSSPSLARAPLGQHHRMSHHEMHSQPLLSALDVDLESEQPKLSQLMSPFKSVAELPMTEATRTRTNNFGEDLIKSYSSHPFLDSISEEIKMEDQSLPSIDQHSYPK